MTRLKQAAYVIGSLGGRPVEKPRDHHHDHRKLRYYRGGGGAVLIEIQFDSTVITFDSTVVTFDS